MQRAGTLEDTPWTEEEVVELLSAAYAGAGATDAEVAAAVRKALQHEGRAVPIGSSGRGIRIECGVSKRLGIR